MIEDGYALLARKTIDSALMDKPPLYAKLWMWMLLKANWKDRDKLKRGQFVATIEDMRQAMSYRVGYRKVVPSKDEIRSAYEAFTKATMITTSKTTRGMVVTILNYDYYQNPSNYEAHTETHTETSTKPTVTPHDTEEGLRRKKEKGKNTPCSSSGDDGDALFDKFWKAYPKKVGKDAARMAWRKRNPDARLVDEMVQALEQHGRYDQWKRDNGRYIPNPATWLNEGRWMDEVPEGPNPGNESWKTGIFAGGI